MSISLSPAIGRNRWCGPGALAILTGLPTDETAGLLRQVSGRTAIKRIRRRYMLAVLDRLGYAAEELARTWNGRGPALEKWAATAPPGVYLVIVTGHYVVVDATAGEVADNHSIYPLPLGRFPRRRKLVRAVWRVEKKIAKKIAIGVESA